jgi:radical SAM protein with 4Fe4S-binding SPASM domain
MTRSGAVEFQTNGQLLTPELLKIMCSAPGYWARVKVSCDGIGETYERIRGAPFSRLDTNLSAYRAYSGKKPALTIEYVAMQHNWHQLREVAQKAVAWGADCLQVSDLHVWPDLPEMRHLDAESLCGIRKSLKRDLDDVLEYGRRNGLRIEVTTDTAAEIGWPVEQFRNNVVTAPTLCLVPHEVAFITASGDVLPCCRVRSSPVGSLKTEDLGSIWIGEKAQVFRKSVEREDTMCAECRLCACRRNWA